MQLITNTTTTCMRSWTLLRAEFGHGFGALLGQAQLITNTTTMRSWTLLGPSAMGPWYKAYTMHMKGLDHRVGVIQKQPLPLLCNNGLLVPFSACKIVLLLFCVVSHSLMQAFAPYGLLL